MEENTRPVWDAKVLKLKNEESRKSESSDVLMLVMLFAVLRLMLPWWFIPYYSEFSYYLYPFMVLSNPDFVQRFGLSSGAYPFINYWLEYPPVFPYIALCIYKIQMLFSTSVDANQARVFSGLVSEFLGLVDIVNLYLIYCIAKKVRNHHFAIRAAAAYALLFFPMVAFISYFDTFVVFTILLALWALINRNVKLSAAMTGIGFMTKMIPLLLVPIAIKYLILTEKAATPPPSPDPDLAPATPPVPITGTERVLTYLGALLVTIFVIAAPLIFVQKDFVFMPFKVAMNRPGWETPRALAGGQTSFGYVGPSEAYLRGNDYFGKMAEENGAYLQPIFAVTSKLGQGGMEGRKYAARIASRFSTDLSYMPDHRDPLKIPLTVFIAGLYLLMLFGTRHKFDPVSITYMTALSFALLFLWSNGWSPQFIMYLLPFVLICLASGRNIAFALVLSLVNFIELPIWLLVRVNSGEPGAVPVLYAAVILRTALLVILAAAFGAHFFRNRAKNQVQATTEAEATA